MNKLLLSLSLCIVSGIAISYPQQPIDISRVIAIESSGDPNAYNEKSGAIGLMQITSIVLEEWNDEHWHCKRISANEFAPVDKHNIGDLYNPPINVKIGKWYLSRIPRYYEIWGIPPTVDHILIGYNWGVGNLKKWWFAGADPDKLPKETREYLRKYREGVE